MLVSSARSQPLRRRNQSVVIAVALVLVCEAVGIVGSRFTDTGAGSWYDQLDKPSFNPPGWVFAPVWITLYALLGISAWLVLRTPAGERRATAIGAFVIQLVLNGLWTPIFFGAERATVALIVIVLLDIAATVMVVAFHRVDPRAAWMNVPYLAWLAYATLLNASIVVLN